MPYFTKQALNQFIRTECQRQLKLNLFPEPQCTAERQELGMPPEQPPRPGLEYLTQAGTEWEAKKLNDLTTTLGYDRLVGRRRENERGEYVYSPAQLDQILPGAVPASFLVEASFDVPSLLIENLGIRAVVEAHRLRFSGVRPDLIQVLQPGRQSFVIDAAGQVERCPVGDPRKQLRVIEIKLTAEPSPAYFAEVTFYSMAMASWLVEHELDEEFVVVRDAAVWPGSHEASTLVTQEQNIRAMGRVPEPEELIQALGEDLEIVPYEVFAARVRRFFTSDVDGVLSRPWRELSWHVDNRCQGCDFLGYPWIGADGEPTNHPDHCYPEAARRAHLSQVAFVTRGAREALEQAGVPDVRDLAGRAHDEIVFDDHHVLRATRTIVSGRATALGTQHSAIPENVGTSAVLPRWPDLRIYISADFDIGSAITLAFGISGFWMEPYHDGDRSVQSWAPRAFVVDRKDLNSEERELLAFLDHLHAILTSVRGLDATSTVQIFVWDTLTYEHLTRVIGRHLTAILRNRSIQYLAWLFPPEEVLPNYRQSTHRAPVTTVKHVVRAVLAAPVPHFYSLLNVARNYHPDGTPENVARYSVHPLFEDPLSDQIPSERAHEIWSRSTRPRRHWMDQIDALRRAVGTRLRALESVTRRLQDDLAPHLQKKAPPVPQLGGAPRVSRVSIDGQLWYAFARLNEALEELEVHQIRAMPAHEREARFQSARLERRLHGDEEAEALELFGLQAAAGRRVYQMRPNSREVKLRPGDFDFALAPEADPQFLDQRVVSLLEGTDLDVPQWQRWQFVDLLTGVTVRAIDRDRGLLVVDEDTFPRVRSTDLENHGLVNLERDVVLDPKHITHFSKKLEGALKGIGNPPVAGDNPLVRRATGQLTGRGANRTAHTPAADFLWDGNARQHDPVGLDLEAARTAIEQSRQLDLRLNESQWVAWEHALSRRYFLIWGPPGTGKTRTVRAVAVGALLAAYQEGRPFQILICSSTYRAIDNVLLPVLEMLESPLLGEANIDVRRLRNAGGEPEDHVPPQIDLPVVTWNPPHAITDLKDRLTHRDGLTLVAATPSQVFKLATIGDDEPVQGWFDLILIDEASQMDVAQAILPAATSAAGGGIVLAGDPKQLPPIHKAAPPHGLEDMVGSVYRFAREVHDVEQTMLETNYRSNETLVRFVRSAGYEESLRSHYPNLKLALVEALPEETPQTWPTDLYWTPEWAALATPELSATAFVYDEGRSSQWNRFEADAVVALASVLEGRLGSQLEGELANGGGADAVAYTPEDFWRSAIGVVTPHRAQQGLIVQRLQSAFEGTVAPSLIRDAVDTVERFQGQQRDVIIASFSLGDPDAIALEDEFLLSLNRFNVMASRARAKLIVLVTQQVVDHLASDIEVLRDSRLLKHYIDGFCARSRPMTLGAITDGRTLSVAGSFKYHQP